MPDPTRADADWTDYDETDWDFAARIRNHATRLDGCGSDENLRRFLVEWGYASVWPRKEPPNV